MGRVAGVFDNPPGFPCTPPGVDVLEGGKLTSNNVLTGFSVHRSDRTKELTGKSKGGGVCFFINNSWCDERNIHSIKSFCSPDLELHMLRELSLEPLQTSRFL